MGAGQYRELWSDDYRQIVNDNMVVVIVIETPIGVENAARIVDVPGIDVIFAASTALGNFPPARKSPCDRRLRANEIDSALLPADQQQRAESGAEQTTGCRFRNSRRRPANRTVRPAGQAGNLFLLGQEQGAVRQVGRNEVTARAAIGDNDELTWIPIGFRWIQKAHSAVVVIDDYVAVELAAGDHARAVRAVPREESVYMGARGNIVGLDGAAELNVSGLTVR